MNVVNDVAEVEEDGCYADASRGNVAGGVSFPYGKGRSAHLEKARVEKQ